MTEPGIPSAVAVACRILAGEGHEHFTFGHASARQGDGFFIKRAGIGLSEVTVDDIVFVHRDGTSEPANASLHDELSMHAEIYRQHADIGAVVHTHPPAAVAMSQAPDRFVAVDQDGLVLQDRIAMLDHPGLIATAPDAADLATHLDAEVRALVLRGHGIVTVGGLISEATVVAVMVERACRAVLATRMAGFQPRPLDGSLAPRLEAAGRTEAIWAYLARQHGSLTRPSAAQRAYASWELPL